MAQARVETHDIHGEAHGSGASLTTAKDLQLSSRSWLVSAPFRQGVVCDCGDHGFLGLTSGGVALVDADDLDLVSDNSWWLHSGYAVRTDYSDGEKVSTRMHRVILGVDTDALVDHINHDKADNRRQNIRTCTHGENMMNRNPWGAVRLKGVDYRPKEDRFRARFTRSGKTVVLGQFGTAEEAARAYDEAVITAHGPFARTNASLGLIEADT